ncbi:GNAT family N-acetyltransferase [Vibrio cincinnatiensis]|uniref:GNAT family N-acetyltransferase n=1 Tax=Vibrio cincinnatiensis TaxID=675 RepID=UPI0030B98CC8
MGEDVNQGLLDNSNLIVTAWLNDQLVGVACSVIGFHYCCYLSNLAFDESVQSNGIGKISNLNDQRRVEPKL